MKVVGEIKPLEDPTDINTFIWNGEEFRHKVLKCDNYVWIIQGDTVKCKGLSPFKLILQGGRKRCEYCLISSGFSQKWLLKIDPYPKFEPVSGKPEEVSWVFSNGVWRPEKKSCFRKSFSVKGFVPFWAVLLVLLGVVWDV
jgi:hypothetical protein